MGGNNKSPVKTEKTRKRNANKNLWKSLDRLKELRKKPRALRSEKDRQKITRLKKLIKQAKKGNVTQTKVKRKKKRNTQYLKYLRSDAWAQLKIDIYAARGRKCQKCGSSSRLQIHHLHYRNIFKEEPEDLIILCQPCHQEEHAKPKRKRK